MSAFLATIEPAKLVVVKRTKPMPQHNSISSMRPLATDSTLLPQSQSRDVLMLGGEGPQLECSRQRSLAPMVVRPVTAESDLTWESDENETETNMDEDSSMSASESLEEDLPPRKKRRITVDSGDDSESGSSEYEIEQILAQAKSEVIILAAALKTLTNFTSHRERIPHGCLLHGKALTRIQILGSRRKI